MAHQLIYTSAPRLLEAGRTGFGTVARHRAVSGLLVAAVERVSQFGRSPGQNPRRIVLSHRLIHAGAASYHVFSCIRDAGSDYTGRTNHLAHHVIADAREARAAAEAGLAPADVLRQMRWLSSWNETPRFCTPEEEISLTNFKPNPAYGAWEAATQNPAHALLPVQAQRCLLLMPGEDGALDLFSESLTLMGGFTAWLVSFTTQAEPTDDLADLRWVALQKDSGLRAQVESASRSTFDLTQPDSLPTPKLPETKTSQVRLPDLPVETLPRRTTITLATPTTPLPPLFPEEEERPARSPWLLVTVVALIALIGATAYLLTTRDSPGTTAPAANAASVIQRVQSVDELWTKYRLHLASTRNWLKAEADEGLIEAHRQSLQEIMTVLRQPLRPGNVSLPTRTQDEFTDLVNQVREWQKAVQEGVRDPRWSGEDPQQIETAAKEKLAELEILLGQIKQSFSGLPVTPEVLPEEIQTQVLKHISGTVAPTRGTPRQWQLVLETTHTADSTRPAWMRSWEIAAKPAETLSTQEQDELKTQAEAPDTPAWLRDQIRRILQARAPATAGMAGTTTAKPATTAAPEPVVPADGPASLHPRFILIESALMPLSKALDELPPLPLDPDSQIAIGAAGAAESALTPLRQLGAAGVYRRSFNDQQPLEFHQRRLVRLPDMNTATRVIARKAGGAQVAFELLVLPQSAALVDAWPSSGFVFGQVLDKTKTYLDATASRWLLGLTIIGGQSLRLQHVEDPTCRYRLRAESGRVLVEADPITDSGQRTRLAALDQEIEVLRQGIRLDEQRSKALESSNLAKAQKDEQARRLEESLTSREQRLLQLEEDRKALLPAGPQFLGVRQGIYSLFTGSRRLCEIKIETKS